MKKTLMMVALGAALTASSALAGAISATISVINTNSGAWVATVGSASAVETFGSCSGAPTVLGTCQTFTTFSLVGGIPDSSSSATFFAQGTNQAAVPNGNVNASHAFISAGVFQDVVDNSVTVRSTRLSYNNGTGIFGIGLDFGTQSGGVGTGLTLTLIYSDGSRTAVTYSNGISGYVGITSSDAFQFLQITSADNPIGNQETYTVDNLQFGLTALGAVNPVPEPATLSMMGLGLVGLGLVARRRSS